MLVLGHTPHEVALHITTGILDGIRQLESDAYGRCTASIGLSSSIPVDDNFEALILQADSALYRAKKEGKNRVMRYTPDT